MPRLAIQPHLQSGHSFFPFYVAHCTRKLLLLLDPKRTGAVGIEQLLLSPHLDELTACA